MVLSHFGEDRKKAVKGYWVGVMKTASLTIGTTTLLWLGRPANKRCPSIHRWSTATSTWLPSGRPPGRNADIEKAVLRQARGELAKSALVSRQQAGESRLPPRVA